MSIRSILLHLANDPGHAGRMEVALDLARRYGASLRAVFAEPAGMPDVVAGRGFSYAFVSESREAARETASRLSRHLADACSREGIRYEWVEEPVEPIELIERQAVFADLVIVGRRPIELGLEPDVCEELPAQVPCPVLTVPENWSVSMVGRRVLVAWNGSLPSARALHGALPILGRAENVTVLTVGDDAPDTRPVVRYLALHDVDATPRRDYGDADDAGEVILSVADELAADLIVMGSYSHARWREMILGGATRHVVTHMQTPVLFGH